MIGRLATVRFEAGGRTAGADCCASSVSLQGVAGEELIWCA
jgi:hypothetical protein